MAVRVSQNTKATTWVNNVYPEFKDYAFQLQVSLILNHNQIKNKASDGH